MTRLKREAPGLVPSSISSKVSMFAMMAACVVSIAHGQPNLFVGLPTKAQKTETNTTII